MAGKTHHTAVAVVPPEKVWEPIQVIRRCHDRQIDRWMPHVNLLFPFRPLTDVPADLSKLAAACASVGSFAITLTEFRSFRHASGRCTGSRLSSSLQSLRAFLIRGPLAGTDE